MGARSWGNQKQCHWWSGTTTIKQKKAEAGDWITPRAPSPKWTPIQTGINQRPHLWKVHGQKWNRLMRKACVTKGSISSICCELCGFSLWSAGLWACQLHCRSKHGWTELAWEACVPFTSLATQAMAGSQIISPPAVSNTMIMNNESGQKCNGTTEANFKTHDGSLSLFTFNIQITPKSVLPK
jgi:hypothetical protein